MTITKSPEVLRDSLLVRLSGLHDKRLGYYRRLGLDPEGGGYTADKRKVVTRSSEPDDLTARSKDTGS